LDHRLRTGASLLGAWLTNLTRAPDGRGARRPPRRPPHPDAPRLFDDEDVESAVRDALPARFSLESTPNDSLEQVRAKERLFAAMTARDAALSRWKRVAHLWCAGWFL